MTRFTRSMASAAFAMVAVTASVPSEAHAGRGGVIYSYGDTITHVQDMPPEAAAFGGSKLGWRHDHLEVFWLPIWGSSDGSWVLYEDEGDGWRFRQLPPALAEMTFAAAGIEPSPPGFFARSWGGLLLLALILGGLGLNKVRFGTFTHPGARRAAR